MQSKLALLCCRFQREGVLFGVKRQGRCMIADEMGLGKTVQASTSLYDSCAFMRPPSHGQIVPTVRLILQNLVTATLHDMLTHACNAMPCSISDTSHSLLHTQAVLIAACFSEDWPLLIICPSSLRYVWRDELLEWLPDSLKTASDHLIVIDAGKVGRYARRLRNACTSTCVQITDVM